MEVGFASIRNSDSAVFTWVEGIVVVGLTSPFESSHEGVIFKFLNKGILMELAGHYMGAPDEAVLAAVIT